MRPEHRRELAGQLGPSMVLMVSARSFLKQLHNPAENITRMFLICGNSGSRSHCCGSDAPQDTGGSEARKDKPWKPHNCDLQEGYKAGLKVSTFQEARARLCCAGEGVRRVRTLSAITYLQKKVFVHLC